MTSVMIRTTNFVIENCIQAFDMSVTTLIIVWRVSKPTKYRCRCPLLSCIDLKVLPWYPISSESILFDQIRPDPRDRRYRTHCPDSISIVPRLLFGGCLYLVRAPFAGRWDPKIVNTYGLERFDLTAQAIPVFASALTIPFPSFQKSWIIGCRLAIS